MPGDARYELTFLANLDPGNIGAYADKVLQALARIDEAAAGGSYGGAAGGGGGGARVGVVEELAGGLGEFQAKFQQAIRQAAIAGFRDLNFDAIAQQLSQTVSRVESARGARVGRPVPQRDEPGRRETRTGYVGPVVPRASGVSEAEERRRLQTERNQLRQQRPSVVASAPLISGEEKEQFAKTFDGLRSDTRRNQWLTQQPSWQPLVQRWAMSEAQKSAIFHESMPGTPGAVEMQARRAEARVQSGNWVDLSRLGGRAAPGDLGRQLSGETLGAKQADTAAVKAIAAQSLEAETSYIQSLNDLRTSNARLNTARLAAATAEDEAALTADDIARDRERTRRTGARQEGMTAGDWDRRYGNTQTASRNTLLAEARARGLQSPEVLNTDVLRTQLTTYRRAGRAQTPEGVGIDTAGMSFEQVVHALDRNSQALKEARQVPATTGGAGHSGDGGGRWGIGGGFMPPGRGNFGGGGGGGHGDETAGENLWQQFVAGGGGWRRGGNIKRTLGLSVGGGLLFSVGMGLQSGLMSAFQQAEKLQRQLIDLQETVRATGQGNQFAGFANNIEQISASTGVATTDVTQLATAFYGLYQNVAQATEATQAASEILAVTGQSASQAGPGIAAVSQDFGLGGGGARQFGNAIVTASRATGRSRADIEQGVSQFAPVAANLGLTLNQATGLVAGISQSSAQSGGTIGEILSRVLPQLRPDMSQLQRYGISFSQQAQGQGPQSIVQALKELLQQYPGLSYGGRQEVTQVLGGQRNTEVLSAAFANPTKALELFNKDYTDNNNLAQANARIQQSVAQSIQRLAQQATVAGSKLLGGGLGQGLTTMTNALRDVVQWGGEVVGWFDRLNNALGGAPATVLELVAAFNLLSRVGGFNMLVGAVGSLERGVSGVFATEGGGRAAAGRLTGGLAGMLNPRITGVGTPPVIAAGRGGAVTGAEAEVTATVRRQEELLTEARVTSETATENLIRAMAELSAATDAGTVSLTGMQTATTKLTVADMANVAAANQDVAAQARLNITEGAGGLTGIAGGLSKVATPGVLGGAIAAYAVASYLSGRSSRQYNRSVGRQEQTIQGLSPDDLQRAATSGRSGPMATKTSTLGYLGEMASSTFGFANVDRHLPLVGHLFGTASESARQYARDTQRYNQVFGSGATGPMTQASIQGIVNATPGGGLTAAMQTALSNALSAYQQKDTAGNFNALQQAFIRATAQPGGWDAAKDAQAAAVHTQTLTDQSGKLGVQFTSISDVSTAFTAGLLNSTQALAAMAAVINTDSTATVQQTQQKNADTAAMKQFTDQLAQSQIQLSQSTAQYLQGADPARLFAQYQQSVGAAIPNELPTTLAQQGQQLAQTASGLNDWLIQSGNPAQLAQLMAGQGGPQISGALAGQVNVADIATGVRPEFGGNLLNIQYENAVNKNAAASRAARFSGLEQSARTPQQVAAYAREAAAASANTNQQALPASVKVPLTPQQILQTAQQQVTLQQAANQANVASLQAQQQGTNTVAQAQMAGDQKSLSLLNAAVAANKGNAAVVQTLQPQVLAAQAQVSQDQVSLMQSQLSAIQAQAQYQKALEFRSPMAQAQTDITAAQAGAAQLGTSIGALQAKAQKGGFGSLSSAQQQVLQEYAQGQQELFQNLASTVNAEIALVQSENLADPLASAQAAVGQLKALIVKQYGSIAAAEAAAKGGDTTAMQELATFNQDVYNAEQQAIDSRVAPLNILASQQAARGDPVGSAQSKLQAALIAMNTWKAEHPGQAVATNTIWAGYVTAYNDALANLINTQVGYIVNLQQEMVTNNQESIAQAITTLRALQAKYANNPQIWEQLQTQIQQYINQGNQNAQFNLPSNLNLPTLYEVRRTEGTPTGATYYGNTGTVNVNINITSPSDVQSAVNRVVQAVGGPPTTGYNLPVN